MVLNPVKVVPLSPGILVAVCNKADIYLTADETKSKSSGYIIKAGDLVHIDLNISIDFEIKGFIEYTKNEVKHNLREGLLRYITGDSGKYINFLYDKEMLITEKDISDNINRSAYMSIGRLLKQDSRFETKGFDNTSGTHGVLSTKEASIFDKIKNVPELELEDSLLSLSIYTGLQPGKIGVVIKETSTIPNRI